VKTNTWSGDIFRSAGPKEKYYGSFAQDPTYQENNILVHHTSFEDNFFDNKERQTQQKGSRLHKALLLKDIEPRRLLGRAAK
jgi:hypothetical protein